MKSLFLIFFVVGLAYANSDYKKTCDSLEQSIYLDPIRIAKILK